MKLSFNKNGNTFSFDGRSQKTESKALKIVNGGGSYYIDLTTNKDLSSHPEVKVVSSGTTYYLRDKYFNGDGGNGSSGGHSSPKIIRPSSPITFDMTVPIGNYNHFKISCNANFECFAYFDYNNSSYWDAGLAKGNLANYTKSHQGGKGPAPTLNDVSECQAINMSSPPTSMNGEINVTGNISDISTSNKEIYNSRITDPQGDGSAIRFKISVKRSGDNLNFTYGWYCDGYDERCWGNVSYYMKSGACTYE